MKLPVPSFLDKGQKKEKQNYYLALLLRDEKTSAIVLEEQGGELRLIGKAEETISQPVEDIPYENLLSLLDKTISQAEETLPPKIQTEKTILGVKETWIEDKKIKKEYLSKLKKICDTLSLQPIGFMVVSEAIAHLLKQEEGAPLSAILAEIGQKQVTLSLFRAGKLIESHYREIDEPIPETVDKLLHHFTVDVLPSRIILFNGRSENLEQEFITHQWSHGLPFLHVPQIAILPKEFDGKAMIVGVAEQLGFTVSESIGETKVQTLETSQSSTISTHHGDKTVDESPPSSKTDNGTPNSPSSPLTSAEELGFMIGKDVAKEPVKAPSDDTLLSDVHDTASLRHPAAIPVVHGSEHDSLRLPEEMHHNSLKEDEEEPTHSKNRSSFFSLGGITGIFSSVLSHIPRPSLTRPSLPFLPFGRRLVFVLPLLFLVLGAIIYLYFTKVTATVTLAVQPQMVNEDEAIVLAAGRNNNFSNGTLAARAVEIAVEGEEKVAATGKKEVGEKAKGTVTLFNSADQQPSLPKGTTLTATNGREFVTEADVTIASASGDIFSGIKSGTTKVNVVAKEIGEEYNMPSDTKFSVQGSTTLAGKNESAFSGGSKRTITVVSEKDLATLSETLPKKLEKEAKKQLASRAQTGEQVLGVFTDISMEEENTSNEVGDEAKEVSMRATVTYKTLSYKQDDVLELAKSTLINNAAQNLTLAEKSLKTQLKDLEIESEDEVTTSLRVEGGLVPKLEADTITEEISGKSFTEAKEYLASLSQVKSAEITLSPNLPFLPKFLPRQNTNITVEVISNE